MKCIYLRTNLINGKQYVGQAVDFDRREKEWRGSKCYSKGVIDRARTKYGFDNFKVEILRECETQDELSKWEMYYIKELNTKIPNGYNLTDGGEGLNGYQHTEETRKKLSESLKGRVSPRKGIKLSDEAKVKLSESHKGQKAWNKGIPQTEEHKRKQSIAMKGRTFSEETKKKMSEARKGLLVNRKDQSKTVYQYTVDGKLVKIWESTAECGRNEFKFQNVSACCVGKIKTYKGYKWSYQPL